MSPDPSLEEAVSAYQAALEELTREQMPFAWAITQNNLGNTLANLGRRESGTVRLEEAVVAYRAALEGRAQEEGPVNWDATRKNLKIVQTLINFRTGRLQ